MSEDSGESKESGSGMASRVTIGFWRELWQQTKLVFRLIQDPNVAWYLKAVPALALLYVISPIDLISDIIPGLGQLDDLTALIVSAKVFIDMAPQDIVSRHLQSISGGRAILEDDSWAGKIRDDGELVEGEFEVVDPEE